MAFDPLILSDPIPKAQAGGLAARVDQLRSALVEISPTLLAARTGAAFHHRGQSEGEFRLPLFGEPVVLAFPSLEAITGLGQALPLPSQALLFYYFQNASGAPLTDRWVSFADLLDGRIYAQAFQGYTGDRLVKTIAGDFDLLRQVCLSAGGTPGETGDVSAIFPALPRVPLLLSGWLGDEEFPSSAKILFDASARQYLPIDACAILGNMLVSRILKHCREIKS